MDMDEAPQVRFHACFISGQFLMLERSLSAAGGQSRQKKAKCSLVPHNTETRKADRHHYTQSEVLEYRLNALEMGTAAAPGEQGMVTRAGKRGTAAATEKQGMATAKGKAAAKG